MAKKFLIGLRLSKIYFVVF